MNLFTGHRWVLIRHSGVPYLSLAAVMAPVTIFLGFWFRDDFEFKGQSISVLTPLVFFAALTFLWLVYQCPNPINHQIILIGGLASILWVLATYRELNADRGITYSAFLLIPLLFFVAVKPPSFTEVIRAMDVLVIAIVIIAVLATVWEIVGITTRNEFAQTRIIIGDWMPLGPYRWVGPFETTTQAGPVGAFIFVYGLGRKGLIKWIGVTFGALILLAAYSRGAFAAVVVGLLFVLWLTPSVGKFKLTSPRRILILFATVFPLVTYVVIADPTLNGRMPIWVEYFSLMRTDFWIGVGPDGIEAARDLQENSGLAWSMVHGHNLFLDTMVRYGFVATIVAITLAFYGLYLGIKSAHLGCWLPGALLITLFTTNLSDTLIDWRYFDHDYAFWFFSIVLAATFIYNQSTSREFSPLNSLMGGRSIHVNDSKK